MPWYEYSVSDGGYRPLLWVRLWHGKQNIPLVALVDSGADASLLDAEYAYAVGLKRKDALEQRSIGADGESFTTLAWPSAPLELQFQKQRFRFEGSFAEFPEGADGQSLLGRKDFFQRFVVQFWDTKGLMNIDLSPDFAKAPSLEELD